MIVDNNIWNMHIYNFDKIIMVLYFSFLSKKLIRVADIGNTNNHRKKTKHNYIEKTNEHLLVPIMTFICLKNLESG